MHVVELVFGGMTQAVVERSCGRETVERDGGGGEKRACSPLASGRAAQQISAFSPANF